ncbi:MAG: transporter [Muricauda sp.]|nr:transporter [Allomuricauda sp.]MBC29524.1 transporter [Allomuricauda sp.]
MNRILGSILFLMGLAIPLSAQNTKPIGLNEVLVKVQESNANIKISEFELAEAKADYAMGNAIFLPNISVSHTGMATTNPLMAFGSKLNQEILTQADFNPQLLNDPDQIQNYATRVTIEQPLVNVDGYFQRKAAKLTMLARELQFERTKDYLAFEATNAYMQLQLAHKRVEVLGKALKAAKANEAMVADRYDQGLLQKADLLQAKVRANEVENQLVSAQSAIGNASDYLAFLMHEGNTQNYAPISELVPVGAGLGLNESDIDNRADVRAMQLVSKAHQSNYKADKMTFLPRLNAFGSYELFDDDIFQADAQGYTFGASLSWDIFQGSKRFAKVKKSRAKYEKAQIEYENYRSKSAMELQKAKRMLLDAKNRMNTSALALQQSEETLQIRSNRFEQGLEGTTDLLRAEAQYAQKELEYYQTIYEYNYAFAYHNFLTKG